MQYTIVDDDVEEAPVYRCNGRAKQPTRPHKESWPVYGGSTYMDRESTKAAEVVISSSYMQIIGIHFQNPGNKEMYIISIVRLRIRPDVTTPM